MTPDQHTTRLISEVDYEIDHYGPVSLANSIATIVEDRAFDSGKYNQFWSEVTEAFIDVGKRILELQRQHNFKEVA